MSAEDSGPKAVLITELTQRFAAEGLELGAFGHVAITGYVASATYAREVHLQSNCAQAPRRPTYSHRGSWHRRVHLDARAVRLDALATTRFCWACGSAASVVAAVWQAQPVRHAVAAAAEIRLLLDQVDQVTATGDRATLRLHAAALTTSAARAPDGGPAIAAANATAHDLLDAAVALPLPPALLTWAQRHALVARYRAAPVPASVLAAPLGGVAAIDNVFANYATTHPDELKLDASWAPLVGYWDQLAKDLPEGPATLVGVLAATRDHVPASGPARVVASVVPTVDNETEPSLSPTFTVVPASIAQLLAWCAVRARYHCVVAGLPASSAKASVDLVPAVAEGLYAEGCTLAQATTTAAALLYRPAPVHA